MSDKITSGVDKSETDYHVAIVGELALAEVKNAADDLVWGDCLTTPSGKKLDLGTLLDVVSPAMRAKLRGRRLQIRIEFVKPEYQRSWGGLWSTPPENATAIAESEEAEYRKLAMGNSEPRSIILEAKSALERCDTMPVPRFEHRPLEIVPNDLLWRDPVFCKAMKMSEEKR